MTSAPERPSRMLRKVLGPRLPILRQVPRLPLSLLLSMAVLTGCGDSGEQDFYVEPEVPDNPVAQTEAAAAELEGREALPNTSRILEVGGSGAAGEVAMTERGDDLVVVVQAEGLPGAAEYAVHVHRGVCSEGGPVAAALNPIVGLDDGTGASTSRLAAAEVSPSEPLFVQIHGTDGAPIACGDLVESES